jgi:hypothetical protein
LVDLAFDGTIRVRRYLCCCCKRTLSLLPDFALRALQMLESIGWIAAHRFLFADLRVHLLGRPAFLSPTGRIAALPPATPSA